MSPSVYSCFGLVLRVPPLVVLPRRTCRRLRTAHSTHAQHKTSSNGYTMAALHLQLTSVQLGCLRYQRGRKGESLDDCCSAMALACLVSYFFVDLPLRSRFQSARWRNGSFSAP